MLLTALTMILMGSDSRLEAMLGRVSATELRKTVEDLVGFHNRNTNGESSGGKVGVGAARRYLKAKLDGYAKSPGSRLEVSEDWFEAMGPRFKTPIQVANVVAKIPGTTDPERLYVVGGHYDSINSDRLDVEGFAPGADDDASGTAVVVELARVLSQERFPATILLVAYVGEEQGLCGSKHHAAALQKAGAFVDGMITNDIVGGTVGGTGVKDDRGVRIFSASAAGNDSASRQLARLVDELGRAGLPDTEPRLVFRADRFGRGGDHLPFEEKGFPAIRITEPNEDYRHQHQNVRVEEGIQFGDLLQFVNFDYVAKVARLNLATVANLASAPRAPSNVKVKGALAYETTLSWDAVESDDLEAYEAVWRLTTESTWTGSERLGKTPLAVLPLLLDNHVVGVRSVGKGGSKSRVAVPPGM